MGADPLYTAKASTDQVARGLARLLQQYRNKPQFASLVKSYLNRIQELENAAWEVILYRLLPNAEGVQLDSLGRIVGRGRGNLSDSDYLLAIQAAIAIIWSDGTPDQMIAIAAKSLPVGAVFLYQEAYPAFALFTLVTPETVTIVSVLFQSLTRSKPGGVKLFLAWFPVVAGNIFTFSPYSSPVHSTSLGFSDYYNPGAGGFFAGVFGS